MKNLNFVPDDYVQTNESQRTNILYLVLFLVVMLGLGGAFGTIKARQSSLSEKEMEVNMRINDVKESIRQFEELQKKKKSMAKTVMMTAELLEPVPRSVLLASLTNHLPVGASLIKVNVMQKQVLVSTPVKKSNYANKQNEEKARPRKVNQLHINLQGIAPSDIQVASYIESLASSRLLEKVELVESREHKIDEAAFREFKLTAVLKRDIELTDEDISDIRSGCKDFGQIY